MTKESAAEIILNLINVAEADKIEFTIAEIRALKKAYVTLNSEPTTNADRIRTMTDEELSFFLDNATVCVCFPCTRDINNLKHFNNCKHENGTCEKEWLEWLKEEAEGQSNGRTDDQPDRDGH